MQILNNDDLDLSADQGERITVRAVSLKAGDTVAFSLNEVDGGQLPNPFTFQCDKAQGNPTVLTLAFTFVGAGGRFDVTVTGNHGGPPSKVVFDQLGLATATISYVFQIV